MCGLVDLCCGLVDLWACGLVDLWTCGLVDLWTCGLVDFGLSQKNTKRPDVLSGAQRATCSLVEINNNKIKNIIKR